MERPILVRYVRRSSRFGEIAVVWFEGSRGPRVRRVLLPGRDVSSRAAVLFPAARRGTTGAISELADRLASFLDGEDVRFSLRLVDWGECTRFQRAVLKAEHGIPRGWVSTYGAIARRVGVPGGARAVGRALATNPFPLVVPCHRAVAAGGMLGGYQGGPAMKRALLMSEGVAFTARGRAVAPRYFYP